MYVWLCLAVCRYAPLELELSIFHDNIVVVASFVT